MVRRFCRATDPAQSRNPIPVAPRSPYYQATAPRMRMPCAASGFLSPLEVTHKAADIFAGVFRKIVAREENRSRAQRFILQRLVSVVAKDLGLLPGEIAEKESFYIPRLSTVP